MQEWLLKRGRITFWGNDQTSTFRCTSVDSLDDVDELHTVFKVRQLRRFDHQSQSRRGEERGIYLLFVIHRPINLVVVTRSQIYHDVLVACWFTLSRSIRCIIDQ